MDADALTLGTCDFVIIIVIIALLGIFVGFALRDKITFKMGARNILRRKGNTIIVVSGLLIGTMIITSSFVVGDTLTNMIEHIILDAAADSDFILTGDSESDVEIIINDENYTYYQEFIWSINDLGDGDKIDGVAGEYSSYAYMKNPNTNLAEPTARMIGYNITDSPALGKLTVDGKEVEWDIPLGEVYINKALADSTDTKKGDIVSFLVFPGLDTPYGKNMFKVRDVVDKAGRGGFNLGRNVFMPVEYTQQMFDVDGVNAIFISNVGNANTGRFKSDYVRAELEPFLANGSTNPLGLVIDFDKKQDIEDAKQGMEMFTQVFLVLSTFSIIAGILLVINIFVMLGEERKTEMGISRAVGMKRRQLAKMFTFEGVLYSAIASFVGVIFGVIVAYIIMRFVDQIFSGISADIQFGIIEYFEFTPNSLLIGFLMGFVITTVTVMATSWRISKLNIVRAVRNIPEPPISKESKTVTILGIIMVTAGAIFIPMAYILDISNARIDLVVFTLYHRYCLAIATTGMSLSLLGLGVIMRRFVGDRISFTATCSIMLAIWIVPWSQMPFNPFPWEGDMEMFVISGVFMVTSSIFILMFNNQLLLKAVLFIFGLLRLRTGPIKTAISYPMKSKFRTGMTIFMFALVIFTITTLTMMTGIFGYSISQITDEQSGGTEIVGYSQAQNALFYRDVDVWAIMNESAVVTDEIDMIHTLGSTYYFVEFPPEVVGPLMPLFQGQGDDMDDLVASLSGDDGSATLPMSYLTVNDRFVQSGGFPLLERDQNYTSDQAAWDDIVTNDSVVIVDSSLNRGLEQMAMAGFVPPNTTALEVGMTLTMSFDGSVYFERTIIGITNQSAVVGFFFHETQAAETADQRHFLYELDTGADPDDLADDLEDELDLMVKVFEPGEGGEFEVFAFAEAENTYFRNTYTIWDLINQTDELDAKMFNNIYSLTSSLTQMNFTQEGEGPDPFTGEYQDFYYPVIGCDDNFIENNQYQFGSYDKEMFNSERDVWEAVRTNSSIAVVDGGLGGEFGPPGSGTAEVGNYVNITLPDGSTHYVLIVGMLKQAFIPGVFMYEDFVDPIFSPPIPTTFLFDVASGYNDDDIGKKIEANLGMETIVIETLIDQFVQTLNMFFSLFQAFLGLGLIVGIAGLGIITLRAVHERRQEIGMMRAIGFKKRGVMASFLIEASFVAMMGIIIGSLLGIALGWQLWVDELRAEQMEFYIDWAKIIIVAIIAYGATAIFTVPPSYAASQVAPAEALRYE